MRPSNTNTQEIERQIEANQPSSSEQAADLAALSAAAMAGDPVPVPGAEPVRDTGPSLADELAGLVTVAVGILGPVFPSLPRIYTQEVTRAAATATAAVCEKHGWLSAGVMGKWGEEIAAGAILLPLAYQTAQGVRADLAARRAVEQSKPARVERSGAPEQVRAEAVPTEQPGARTVTFGAPAAQPAGEGASA